MSLTPSASASPPTDIDSPSEVAYMEFAMILGAEYADELSRTGRLTDGVVDFEGLLWSETEQRAVVYLPGRPDPVVVGLLDEIAYNWRLDLYVVLYDRRVYQIQAPMARGLIRMREILDEWRSRPPPLPPPAAEADPVASYGDPVAVCKEDPVAAFESDRERLGENLALLEAILRVDHDDGMDFSRFSWDHDTSQLVVALPELDAPVALDDLEELWFAEDGEHMWVWCVSLDDWVSVPFDTDLALDHLLTLRDGEAEWASARAAPPAGGAVSPQPPPGSPGRADTDGSTAPCAATSTNDYSHTAPAAAGASTMPADVAMVGSNTLDGESETDALDDAKDDGGSAEERKSVDDADFDDVN